MVVCSFGGCHICGLYGRRKRVDDETAAEEGEGKAESWSEITIHLLPSCGNCQHRSPKWLTHDFCRYGNPYFYRNLWRGLDNISPCGFYRFREEEESKIRRK